MFWIIGGDFVVRYLYEWSAHPGLGAVWRQLAHTDWGGGCAYDLIFPRFIFLVIIGSAPAPIMARTALS